MLNLTGKVFKKLFAAGSKSEHVAIMLETSDGVTYKLVQLGSNPFANDPKLEKLVGKTIEAQGNISRSQFILTNWKLKK